MLVATLQCTFVIMAWGPAWLKGSDLPGPWPGPRHGHEMIDLEANTEPAV